MPTEIISFPSLDPIEKKTAYPVEMSRSRRHHPFTREDIQAVMEVLPFETLPRDFVPIKGARYRPPLFYYGWRVNSTDLYDYARKHDYVRAALADSDTEEPAATNDIPSLEELDSMSRLDVADYTVLTVAEECGINLPVTGSPIKLALGDGRGATVFVLYDNFHFNHALTTEQVQSIQDKLERSDPPKWYGDGNGEFRWRRRVKH